MATLVQFLAAGVNGAESGTATFVLRGTSTSAASLLYNDFEGTTQPGTNVIVLDANGSAEVYCDAYVDVQLRDVSGTLLRTVTVGNSASLVEVQSTSFTGTDYDNDPANTIGEPITLKALLDKWIASAGAPDWQILSNGVPTNIQTALAGLSGMFFNVKAPQYGAVGDGVTDDTTAILSAILDAQTADGGIVFFPPGTYQVSILNPTAPNVTLMGCGEESSIIRGTSGGTFLLSFLDSTATSAKRITNLGFAATVPYDCILEILQDQQLTIDTCKFNGENIDVACIRRVDADGLSNIIIYNCRFVGIESTYGIKNLSGDNESFISVSGCLFQMESTFVGGACIEGPDFSIGQCVFDASAITSGVYCHIHPSSAETPSKFLGNFVGNTFIDGGSDGVVFFLPGGIEPLSLFAESANQFIGFQDPDTVSDTGQIYECDGMAPGDSQVILASRLNRVLRFTVSTTSIALAANLMADTIMITITQPGLVIFLINQGLRMPFGAKTVILVDNASGAPANVVFFFHTLLSVTISAVPDGGTAFGEIMQSPTGGALLLTSGSWQF